MAGVAGMPKAKELGYPHELWTTQLLTRHAREHGPAEGHAGLANLAQGTVCKILDKEAFAREHEYRPHGTVSLLADLITGKVHALVKNRHRSREFIEFLKLLDAAYPAHTAIKLILCNHSAHIPKKREPVSQPARSPLRIHFQSEAWFMAQSG